MLSIRGFFRKCCKKPIGENLPLLPNDALKTPEPKPELTIAISDNTTEPAKTTSGTHAKTIINFSLCLGLLSASIYYLQKAVECKKDEYTPALDAYLKTAWNNTSCNEWLPVTSQDVCTNGIAKLEDLDIPPCYSSLTEVCQIKNECIDYGLTASGSAVALIIGVVAYTRIEACINKARAGAKDPTDPGSPSSTVEFNVPSTSSDEETPSSPLTARPDSKRQLMRTSL